MFAVAALLFTAACQKGGEMIQAGSQVKFNYTLRVDGQVVDSSEGREPLSYVQGRGDIIPGLEEEMAGLKAGDKKQVSIAPEKGYGTHNPQAVQKVPKANFGEAKGLKVGDLVRGQAGGREFRARVTEIGAKDVTLDLNHPLAGKTLNFDVEVVEVQPPATAQQQ